MRFAKRPARWRIFRGSRGDVPRVGEWRVLDAQFVNPGTVFGRREFLARRDRPGFRHSASWTRVNALMKNAQPGLRSAPDPAFIEPYWGSCVAENRGLCLGPGPCLRRLC